jgi:hypothetical protein
VLFSKSYFVNGKNVVYPKDPQSGRNLHVVDENGTVLVLMGLMKSMLLTPYRKSRGLIVLTLLVIVLQRIFDEIDLDIEPFTLVLFQEQLLFFNSVEWENLKRKLR